MRLIFVIVFIFFELFLFESGTFAACNGVTFDGCANFTYYCSGSYSVVSWTCGAFNGTYCPSIYRDTQIGNCDGGCKWQIDGNSHPQGCKEWAPVGCTDGNPLTLCSCALNTDDRYGTCCSNCPACTPTSCSATCPTGCGYGGGTVTGTDNCGGSCSISCGATGSCCSPNCSDSGNYCSGVGYTGNCGQGCTGTKGPDCSGSGTVCSGTSYASPNGCGTCTGTKGPVCADPSTACIGATITSSSGCGTCAPGTKGPVCADPSTVCSGTPITSSNGCTTTTCSPGSSCACAPGTKGPVCADPSTVCSGTPITSSNGCGTCAAGTKCSTPGTPTLNSPVGGTEVAGTSISFSWNAPGYGTCDGGGGTYNHCVDGSCTNVGNVTTTSKTVAGGSHSWYVNAVNSCGATGANSATGTFCAESWTSARVSSWSAFGACNVGHVRTRTRTCSEDCSAGTSNCSNYFAANCPAGSTCVTTGSGLSRTQTETQTCYGRMTGTFFDASDFSVCPANPQTLTGNLKISGGTINLTGPTSYGPYTTNATGLYTTAATVLSPDTYTLSVDPGGAYISAAKFNCQGTTLTLTGSAAGCLTQPCETAPTTTHDFGFWKVYGGWWQARGGSAYGGSGIQSNIPGTVAAADRYLILRDADLQHGLAQIKSGTINLGTYPGVTNSVSDWNATSGYSGDDMDYSYFVAKMGSYNKTTLATLTSKPSYTPGGNGYEIYTFTGNPTMNWSPAAGEKVIYLINGDVTVSANIAVPTASATFLAVIASGTIIVNSGVTNVEGWWIGNSLDFASAGAKSDTQFVGEGSFIGWSSISLSRDQTGILNNSQPAEMFVFRPDLIINAPAPMMQSKYQWRQQ